MALAPSCAACSAMRWKAWARVSSQRLVKSVMSPPTMVCKLAPSVPKIERERTMMPRTIPMFRSMAIAIQREGGGHHGIRARLVEDSLHRGEVSILALAFDGVGRRVKMSR